MKAVVTKSKRAEPYEVLYRAVGKYVRALGGTVTIAEGVQVLQWPGDEPQKFSICVKCFGLKPQLQKKAGTA